MVKVGVKWSIIFYAWIRAKAKQMGVELYDF